MTTEENIQRFEALMGKVTRDGVGNLMGWIRASDFFSCPASAQYHLSCDGGLLQHSLNVYDCLIAKRASPIWGKILSGIPDESLILSSLLHDLCKVNYYIKGTKNQKTYDLEKVSSAETWKRKHDDQGDFIWETVLRYEVSDRIPLGHGEKSVILISYFLKLTVDELMAIRWHMGFSEDKSQYKALGDAIEKYPLVLALHEADLEASKLLEGNNRNKEI